MKTFLKGGVHPNDNKLTGELPIEDFPLPSSVAVLLHQNIGAPAFPIVEKGMRVKVGTLIGEGRAAISANIHSPVSGVVSRVDVCKNYAGMEDTAIYIDVEGDEWEESIDRSPEVVRECAMEPREIITRIKRMGIVGLGGATFPTHVKYTISEGKRAEYLIVNGVECEPYITSDHRLMLEHAEEICVGIKIACKAIGVEKAIVGIEANKPEPIEAMTKMAAQYGGIEVCPLKVKYPQGAEKQLIQSTTGRSVPSGKLPIDVGCVVSNVATIFAVYEAVQKNKPLFEHVVTLTGGNLASRHNYRMRYGITYNDVVNHALGGLPENTGKVICGGTMMGKVIINLGAPVTKGVNSILVLDSNESYRTPETACIKCGKCVSVCPMGLEPYLLSAYIRTDNLEEAKRHNLMDCVECGCCTFICPAYKRLTSEMNLGKNLIRALAAKK